jgi:hypothetical protein
LFKPIRHLQLGFGGSFITPGKLKSKYLAEMEASARKNFSERRAIAW